MSTCDRALTWSKRPGCKVVKAVLCPESLAGNGGVLVLIVLDRMVAAYAGQHVSGALPGGLK